MNDHLQQLVLRIVNCTEQREDLDEIIRLLKEDNSGETTKQLQQIMGISDSTLIESIHEPSYWKEITGSVLAVHRGIADLPKSASIRTAHRMPFLISPKARVWLRYAAAIILIVGACVYLWTAKTKTSPIATTKSGNIAPTILPGTQKAVLTLSDGKTIQLSDTSSEIINDGTLTIENENGKLMYSPGNVSALNTMTTPKGGQYQVTLADGTRVWLNAATTIQYPTSFSGNTRKVTITGEAYLEIAKDAAKPFVVITHDQEITVLGTSFNVNAYAEDGPGKTSLLEGSVKITDKILKPGEAFINGKIIETNIEQDLAWKNGAFDFDRVKLKDAMRQISRWYNIDVLLKDDVAELELRGQIGRDLSLQQVMNGLEDKHVHFKIENGVLTVYR